MIADGTVRRHHCDSVGVRVEGELDTRRTQVSLSCRVLRRTGAMHYTGRTFLPDTVPEYSGTVGNVAATVAGRIRNFVEKFQFSH